jgi:anthranilate synthase component II
VLSPGPCDPDRAGICLALIAAAAEARLPLLGVCLGHQAIGQAFGGRVVRADAIMHGKLDQVTHDGTGVFRGPPLALRGDALPQPRGRAGEPARYARVTAEVADGTIMGLAHRDLPIHGVQFHPESIASEHGHALLRNFLDLARRPAPLAA